MTFELTTNFDDSGRCERCDTILAASVYRDIPVILVTKREPNLRTRLRKFCIRCVIHKTVGNHHSNRVTTTEIDSFLELNPVEIIPKVIIPNKKIQKVDPNYITFRCRHSNHKECTSGIRSSPCQCKCHNEVSNE